MGVRKLGAVATSLTLVGAAALTAAGAAASAQSAETTAPVTVSISSTRAITMPTTIQPGVNTFKVTTANKKGSAFQLVRPAAGYSRADASRDIDKGLDGNNMKALKRFEANITLLGGVGVTKGKVATLAVDLAAGSYWALDTNINDASKFLPFTVAGADTGNVLPEAGATLKARLATTWANKPASIPHRGLLHFKNAASNNHFVVLSKLKKGMTYGDFKKWIKSAQTGPGGPPPVNFSIGLDSGVVSPGYSATFSYNLPKGDYVLMCFWPDASMGGIPHVFMGMHRGITLK